jgi:hypothetical protein
MLKSGWSPARIAEWLEQNVPEEQQISEETIRDYVKTYLKADEILQPSYVEKKLKEINVSIDTLRELYNLIELQKQRLSLILRVEDDSNITLPDGHREVELLRDTILSAVELEMKLGIRKQAPIEVLSGAYTVPVLIEEILKRKKEGLDKDYAELTSP